MVLQCSHFIHRRSLDTFYKHTVESIRCQLTPILEFDPWNGIYLWCLCSPKTSRRFQSYLIIFQIKSYAPYCLVAPIGEPVDGLRLASQWWRHTPHKTIKKLSRLCTHIITLQFYENCQNSVVESDAEGPLFCLWFWFYCDHIFCFLMFTAIVLMRPYV